MNKYCDEQFLESLDVQAIKSQTESGKTLLDDGTYVGTGLDLLFMTSQGRTGRSGCRAICNVEN